MKNNERALDDENVKASWLTKSMAGYLPQLKDQIVPELIGGGVGGILGYAVGMPDKGAAIGAGIGTGLQSYGVIRGSVYRTLLEEGVDEETALSAAKDEALISSLIEGGETAVSLLLAGGGKAINAISGAAKASVAKGSTNAATKFVANFATNRAASTAVAEVTKPLWRKGLNLAGSVALQGGTEYLEEFTQGAVSRANQERALSGTPISGKGQLVTGAGEVIVDAVTGKDPEALADLHSQGVEGFKIGVMLGGSKATVNNIVLHYANAKTAKLKNEVADTILEDEESLNALIEEGKASGEGTVSEKIATEIETARENGKEVTREQVKQLIESNEVYIKAEESNTPDPIEQTAREVVEERNKKSTPIYERLEALSRNNEPISVTDVKKATGFGVNGSEVVAKTANVDGATFYQTVAEVKPSYMAGFNNPDMDIKKVAHTFVSDAQADAYTAGQIDGKMKALAQEERAKNAVSKTVESEKNTPQPSPVVTPSPQGEVYATEQYDIPEGSEIVNNVVVDEYSKRLKGENPRAYSNIVRMARRLGMNVRVVGELTDENGNVLEGLITSKGVFINADAKNPSRFVATHEFGHRMKQAAPKVWAKYQEYVINKLKNELFDSERTAYDVLYEETKNAYRKDDTDSINEEIAVNYAGELFDSEEMLEAFIRENKSLAMKVRDWWYNVLDKMGLLSEKKKAQQLWLRAYTAAGKSVKDGKVGEFSGEKFKYVGETKNGIKKYVTDFPEGMNFKTREKLFKERIATIFNLGAVKLKTDVKKIQVLGDKFTGLKNVHGDEIASDVEMGAKVNSLYDIAEILSESKYVGKEAEPSFTNPVVKPKNKAHKDVKYWYKFQNTISMDGQIYDVVFNIRDKGKEQYQYLIEFHKKGDNSNQPYSHKDLLLTLDELSPTDNVPQNMSTVKNNSMQNIAEHTQEGKKSIAGTRLSELVEKYGAIPQGENPHRDVQLPRKTEKNKKVSQTVRTILEAMVTPDEAVPTIEKMVEDGIFSYDVYTDKQAISDSEEYIKTYGWDESLDNWFDAVNKGGVSKELTTRGWALYNNAANIAATATSETERTTAIKTSLKILDAMVRHQRSAAQALQATRILKKLSPETQLYGVQKSVQAFQNELAEKYGDKAPDLTIDENLAEQFLTAETEEERAEIEKEIYKDIGRQMPSRFIDKWNAWRYLAMLGNARTHIRNFFGNAFFAPVVGVKNLTATAIEEAVYRVSGKKTVRGKSLVWGSKTDRALLKAAWSDYGNVADLVSNGGKYNDSAMANQHIQEGRQIFKFKPLEWARKGNSKLLEREDMWFSQPHYAYALAQYCKANNITPEQISRGKAIAPARDYAIKEAQKATYRDTNAFSQMVSEWGRGNRNEKNVVKKAFNTVIEGILPFRKTPANILVRGVEYSPLGLLKGLSYDLVQVGKGKKTATEAIDNISAGLTGSGLLALGVYLAAQGLIRGHGEDEEEKEFKELMGHQSYALELPNGQSITLDWLAPEALPFFVGVNIWESTKGSDEDANLSTILQSVTHITEPMLEMSCLQGLNDLFEGIGYASSNNTSGLVSVVSSAVTSYLTQGIPTLLGQAERTGEENRLSTYTEKNDFLTGDMQYTLGKASAKIPFWDYNQIPYIDAWGRKEASGTALKRGLNNFFNPAYTSTIESSKMEEELLRLYELTGEGGVFPERADKYFTVDGERKDLTAEEYVRYATLKGEKSYKLVSDLVKSRAYKNLSSTEKVKAIEEAYDYANQKAKQAISNYKPDTWVKKADEFGSNVGNYISFKTEVSSTKESNGGKISKQEVVDIVLNMAQNDSETWKMYLSMYDSNNDLYAYNEGIEGETYMSFLETLNEYDTPTKSGKYGTHTQDEAERAIRNIEGLSREERAILWQSVNTSWKAKNNPWR